MQQVRVYLRVLCWIVMVRCAIATTDSRGMFETESHFICDRCRPLVASGRLTDDVAASSSYCGVSRWWTFRVYSTPSCPSIFYRTWSVIFGDRCRMDQRHRRWPVAIHSSGLPTAFRWSPTTANVTSAPDVSDGSVRVVIAAICRSAGAAGWHEDRDDVVAPVEFRRSLSEFSSKQNPNEFGRGHPA